jgi:hypothetical protein
MVRGQLLTSSCTTGWLDWIHGELWLLPNGLLRRPLGLAATIAHGMARTISDEPEERDFDGVELRRLRGSPKNLWIEASDIGSVDLRQGFITSRLLVHLRDGRRRKLLWLVADPVGVTLRDALAKWGIPA